MVFLNCIMLFLFFDSAFGNIDLYLPKNEVRKLFGVDDMELYYIRDGTINHNAIKFTPHMQPEQDAMVFMWKTTFTDIDVPYEVEKSIVEESERSDKNYSIPKNSQQLVETLSINIDKSGKVPHEVQKFHVQAGCTGVRSGEVIVQMTLKLRLNIEVDPQEITTINLRRLRKCLESHDHNLDITNNNAGSKQNSAGNNNHQSVINGDRYDNHNQIPMNHNPSVNQQNNLSSQSSGSFFISISVVTGTIVLSLLIFFIIWRTRSGRKHQSPSLNGACRIGVNGGIQQNQFLRPDIPNNAQVMLQGSNWMRLTPIINDLGTDISEIRSKLSSIAVPHEGTVLKETLTEGTFGRIFKGFINNDFPVIVKTVSDVASEEQVRLLLYESSLLRGMHHRNILPIKHVVFDGPEKPLVIFPYVKGGNLKRYLQDLKLTDSSSNSFASEHQNKYEQASTQDLVEIGIQIACGMSYMIKRGLVHKDLATRNCVIDTDLKVKITDNALARDLFPEDYCCLGDNENRPLRWLAIESLVHKVYSSSSDVWSFGVLLWELQSFAAKPYDDIDDFEMERFLKNGYRLSQPVNCPDHLYGIMAQCWHYSTDKRPMFNQILQMLTEFHAELGEYV